MRVQAMLFGSFCPVSKLTNDFKLHIVNSIIPLSLVHGYLYHSFRIQVSQLASTTITFSLYWRTLNFQQRYLTISLFSWYIRLNAKKWKLYYSSIWISSVTTCKIVSVLLIFRVVLNFWFFKLEAPVVLNVLRQILAIPLITSLLDG